MTIPKGEPRRRLSGSDEPSDAILALFDGGGNGEEAVIEAIVGTAVSEFVQASNVSTDVDDESFAAAFSTSRIPVNSSSPASYFNNLAHDIAPHCSRNASPRCLGHMTPPVPYFMPHLARLVAALNQNMVKTESSRIFTPFERETVAMLHRLLYGFSESFYQQNAQDSDSTLGMLTSGATGSNLAALWCARNAALAGDEHASPVEVDGLSAALKEQGYIGGVIVGSESMHYSFTKAAGILGLGEAALVRVSTDAHHHIDMHAAFKAVRACQQRGQRVIAIVGVAGSTDSGSIDPLRPLAELAQSAGAHFHVDAAGGGGLLFSDRHRPKLAGIEMADTVTLDGHKHLYVPTGTGILLLSDPKLARLVEQQADYIIRPGSSDLGRRTLEGSRAASALFLHAALRIFGRSGYQVLVDDGIRKTLAAAEVVRARLDFELLLEPESNILLYRYIPSWLRLKASRAALDPDDQSTIDRVNDLIYVAQRRAGRSLVSRTLMTRPLSHGQSRQMVALRAILVNPITTGNDLTAVFDEQASIGASLQASDVQYVV